MKRAVLEITDQLLIDMLKPFKHENKMYTILVENPLPPDAKIVRIEQHPYWAENNICLGVLLESEQFKDVPPAEVYPRLPLPVFKTIYKEKVDK